MGRKHKKAAKPQKEPSPSVTNHHSKQVLCFDGEKLVQLLKSIQREIESARNLDGGLPDKIWVKQQFSVGVNDVTRVLERMPALCSAVDSSNPVVENGNIKDTRLQAILLASDCYPQMLTKHLPSLASLKNVPLIYVKDKRRGSLRLGNLVQLKTAIALGIKVTTKPLNYFQLHLSSCEDHKIFTRNLNYSQGLINVTVPDRGNGINHLIKNILNDQELCGPEAQDALKASNMDMLPINEIVPPVKL